MIRIRIKNYADHHIMEWNLLKCFKIPTPSKNIFQKWRGNTFKTKLAQPAACRLYAAQDGFWCCPTQIRKLFEKHHEFFLQFFFFLCSSAMASVSVFYVQSKTVLLVWPREAKRLNTSVLDNPGLWNCTTNRPPLWELLRELLQAEVWKFRSTQKT